MLSDEVRMTSYRNAILLNKDKFRDKVVLDVGCGTGILSMFAAEAGASKVIGVDNADIIDSTRKIVEMNKYSDVITLIKGKVEEITLPDGINQVDIIIHEMIGYCLLFESALNTVLTARNKWLKPHGLVFPDRCYLYMTAIEDPFHNRLVNQNFWDCVQGYDMSCLKENCNTVAAYVKVVDSLTVITNATLIKTVDLCRDSIQDLTFEVPYHIQCQRSGFINGLLTYFDVEFSKCVRRTRFSTAPEEKPTHWRQTVLPFWGTNLPVSKGDGVYGMFDLQTNRLNPRSLQIIVDLKLDVKTSDRNKFWMYKNTFLL